MRTAANIRLARLAKATRRSYPAPKENAHREAKSGRALRLGSGRGNLLLSGKGLGLENRRPCQQS